MSEFSIYYGIYRDEILPLLADMQVRSNFDYFEYYQDICDIYSLIAQAEVRSDITQEEKEELVWLFQKVKIALYSYIVQDMKKRLRFFLNRTNQQERLNAGIHSALDEWHADWLRSLRRIRSHYGKKPKICLECMQEYEALYQQGNRMETEINAHAGRLTWLSTHSRWSWISTYAMWVYSLVISIATGAAYTFYTTHQEQAAKAEGAPSVLESPAQAMQQGKSGKQQ